MFLFSRSALVKTVVDHIVYLNGSSLDALGVSMVDLVPILEEIFHQKADGQTIMPPKIFFHRQGSRFYSSMVSCAPKLGYAGAKWQSGDPQNPSRGLPYIQGLYVMSEDATGQPVAIIDAKWITAQRTAAASALVAKYLARDGAEVLAILGCGLQGRRHLEALKGVVPGLIRCQAFDIDPEREALFVREMSGKFGVEVVGAGGPQAAVRGADVVVTAGPIEEKRNPTILPEWIAPGALVVAIDYDSYVTDAAIAAMDIVVTDDREQIHDARRNEGKFTGVHRIDADLAELVRHGTGRRQSGDQRILAFNLGIALEDIATAAELLKRAREQNIGMQLPR